MSRIKRAGRTGAALSVGLVAAGLCLAAVPGAAHAAQNQALPFTGLSQPQGMAADAAGDVFVANSAGGDVLELPAGATGSSQQVTLPFTGLSTPYGVAVDSVGDVFVSNVGNNRVVELPAGATSSSQQVTLPFTGLSRPAGLAVDAAGDVFVVDSDHNRVVELPAGATSSSQQVTLPFPGSNDPLSVATDAAGDVFVGYADTPEVVELPAGSSTPVRVQYAAADSQQFITADPAGDLFIAEDPDNAISSGYVLEVPAGATSASQDQVLFTSPDVTHDGETIPGYLYGVAANAAGDLFYDDAVVGQAGSVSQVVGTVTSITAPASPSAGQPVTVSVSVRPQFGAQPPAGQVTVSDGGSGSCTATLSGGTGSCQLTDLAAGSSLTASYAGQGIWEPSVSAGTPVTAAQPCLDGGTSAIATSFISADCFTASQGTNNVTAAAGDSSPSGVDGNQVPQLANGDYLEYGDVDFGSGSTQFDARVASGAAPGTSGLVEVVLDNPGNTPVGSFAVANTGGWDSWQTIPANISTVTGVHNVYLEFWSGAPGNPPYVSLHYFDFPVR